MRVVLGLLLLAGLASVCGQEIINPDASNIFHLTNGDGGAYYFGGSATQKNPTLNMSAGTTYYISIEYATSSAHPFGFSTSQTGLAVQANGLAVNGTSPCTSPATGAYYSTGTTAPWCVLSFVAPNATTTSTPLYYHCTVHPLMVGAVQVFVPSAGTTAPPTGGNSTTSPPTTPAPGGNGTTTAPPTTQSINPDGTNTFHVTGAAGGTQGWIFTSGGTQYTNPTLNVAYGNTYTISIEFPTSGIHPFGLNTDQQSLTLAGSYGLNSTTCGGSATGGFTTGSTCTLTFTPPANTPQPLYYHCAFHSKMVGQIVVSGLPKGSGFALVPGFAVLIAVIAGFFAQ